MRHCSRLGRPSSARTAARTCRRWPQRLHQAIAAFPAGLAWTLHVDGHTDDTPIHVSGFASNTALSVARAQAVADYLASRGLPAARLAVGGFGATRPLVQGSSPADRARNRRIELRLTFLGGARSRLNCSAASLA